MPRAKTSASSPISSRRRVTRSAWCAGSCVGYCMNCAGRNCRTPTEGSAPMSRQLITLVVNGDRYQVAVAPHETLLDVIRDQVALTGTKRGCTSGACGVCTVQDADGRALLSCLALAIEWDGR